MCIRDRFFYSSDWTDGTVRRFVRRVGGHEALDDLFALRAGDVTGRGFGEDPETELGELRDRVASVAAADAALKVKDLAINGGDVMRCLLYTSPSPTRLLSISY